MDLKNTNINTSATEGQPVVPPSTIQTKKQLTTSVASNVTEESKCEVSKTLKTNLYGETTIRSFLGDNLLKNREILYLSGAQVFFSEKNEVVLRKSPNLVMSPYQCLQQLKHIYTHLENLKSVASFFENVLLDWESKTREVEDKPA